MQTLLVKNCFQADVAPSREPTLKCADVGEAAQVMGWGYKISRRILHE